MFTKQESGTINTRFKNCRELSTINSLLEQLKEKKNQLESDSKRNNPLSSVYKKHVILADFLLRADSFIDAYNEKYNPHLSISEDLGDLSDLTAALLIEAAKIKASEWEIIFTPRNNNTTLNSVLKYGSIFASSAAGTFAFGPAAGLGFFVGGLVSSMAISKVVGGEKNVSNSMPKTADLLIQLQNNIISLLRQLRPRMGNVNLFEHKLNNICFAPLEFIYENTMSADKAIKMETLYLYPIDSGKSMGCAYKTKNNKIVRLNLRDYLDANDSDMLCLKEKESLGIRQYSAVTAAIYRVFCSPNLNNLSPWSGFNPNELLTPQF